MHHKLICKFFSKFLIAILVVTFIAGGTLINSFACVNLKDKDIDEYISNMTIEEKVGQLFVLRYPQNNLDKACELIEKYKIGGFTLFSCDFKDKTADEVRHMITTIQSKSKIPLIVSVDEEGGIVVRCSGNPKLRNKRFKSPRELYVSGGRDLIKLDTKEKAEFLKDLGVNMNLAPVADVVTNKNGRLYKRALGENAEKTSDYVKTVVEEMNANGIKSVLKHFPGYGNTNKDTHINSSIDKKTISEYRTVDFLPFISGINAGVSGIMVSHTEVPAIDDRPMSMSNKCVEILRKELGFNGLLITDGLDMGAATIYCEKCGEMPGALALKAGFDVLLLLNVEKEYQEILNAVNSGKIPVSQINESVKRVLMLKRVL
ncbi:MAG: Beta-hexosaminidase [Eubacteriales bacterium SKADARSKE-1]|nr:Beta-hexosaminidase [Eubacteriales bacterium SKADARSKE-1]